MAFDATDWTIDRQTKNIRYIGDDHGGTAPTYSTVFDFHTNMQAFADDLTSSGDDELDISDELPTNKQTSNIIELLNGYNIDDTAAEHLFDGSIIQTGGDTIYEGFVNFGNVGVRIGLIQDGALLADDWWNWNVGGTHTGAADQAVLTDSGATWTTDEWVGYTIKNTTDGSEGLITANTATTVTAILRGGTDNDWDNGDAYLISEGLNADATNGISHRFLIKVRDQGVDIDNRKIVGLNRTYGRTFGEFTVNATTRGNNVLALTDSGDINNATAEATVSGWTTITNTEGLRLIDISGDGTSEEYYSEWNVATFTKNQFYERTKWLSRYDSTSTLNGLTGNIFRGPTHSFAYDGETGTMFVTNDEGVWGTAVIFDAGSGTFQVGEAVHENSATPVWKGRVIGGTLTGATGTIVLDVESGVIANDHVFVGQDSSATATINDVSPPTTPTPRAGRMKFFAVDDDGTTGNLYGQLLKGVAPANNDIIYDDASTANNVTVNGTVTERPISAPFIGASTGSAIIGAYGIGIEQADTSSSDRFFDLQNNPITPPNNVTFSVGGLVIGEDTVNVAPWDGVTFDINGDPALDKDQLTLNTSLATDNITSVVVTTAIPSDTPSTGYIRVVDDDGFARRLHYSSWTGSTFTIDSTDGQEDFGTGASATQPKNVWISYIDKVAAATTESFTGVYSTDRDLVVVVRDGGGTPIKQFISSAVFGSSNSTTTAIRTSDE